MNTETAAEFARRLHDAYRTRAPIEPLTAGADLTAADAYEIQREVVALRLADNPGDRIVGHKLGLTSRPMQELLGVDTPDYGPLLASTVHPNSATLALGTFIQPRIEAEIAVVLGDELAGPGVTALDVQRAAAGVTCALEIVDSRIADWRITLADTVADLASCGAVVTSGRLNPTANLDLRLTGMAITRNGRLADTGAGAAALGDPAYAVAWLANTLAPLGTRLEPGHLILTGALHGAFPVAQGDTVRADFDGLGSVTVRVR